MIKQNKYRGDIDCQVIYLLQFSNTKRKEEK